MNFSLIRLSNFEGAPGREELYKWQVPAETLSQALGADTFGASYRLEIYWKGVQPRGRGVYIQGEFIRKDRSVVQSHLIPLSVPLAPPVGAGKKASVGMLK